MNDPVIPRDLDFALHTLTGVSTHLRRLVGSRHFSPLAAARVAEAVRELAEEVELSADGLVEEGAGLVDPEEEAIVEALEIVFSEAREELEKTRRNWYQQRQHSVSSGERKLNIFDQFVADCAADCIRGGK